MALADARARARELTADPAALVPRNPAKVDTVAMLATEYVERHLKPNTKRCGMPSRCWPVMSCHAGGAGRQTRSPCGTCSTCSTRNWTARGRRERVHEPIRCMFDWGDGSWQVEANPAAGIKPRTRAAARPRAVRGELRAACGRMEPHGLPVRQDPAVAAPDRGAARRGRHDARGSDRSRAVASGAGIGRDENREGAPAAAIDAVLEFCERSRGPPARRRCSQ